MSHPLVSTLPVGMGTDLDDGNAIMSSIEYVDLHDPSRTYASVAAAASAAPVASPHFSTREISNEMQSLNLLADCDNDRSLALLDEAENLVVDSAEDLASRLGCSAEVEAKVVAIVGNTGEGKSYALNHAFFKGDEVFSTSPHQASCTLGVRAAFDASLSLVTLDTEGMLGGSSNENRRIRQLLKVLAVSDVVVYKTRAERLHNDLFYFLADASKAYNDHFSAELKKVYKASSSDVPDLSTASWGPSVIIFHETRYTDVLGGGGGLNATSDATHNNLERLIRDRMASLNLDMSAFRRVRYLGYKADDGSNGRSDGRVFLMLRDFVARELGDNSVRSPRSIALIYKTLQALTLKFSGAISSTSHRCFPDEYFTCMSKCASCECRCSKAVNHDGDHNTSSQCIYQKRLENKIFLCKRCFEDGRRLVVVPKASSAQEGTWLGLATYAWSGYVLECARCGVIYRSREHWYGNDSPETKSVVQTEIAHIWPGMRSLQGTQNAARRLLDGVSALTGTVSTLSSGPTKSVGHWVADKIAPDYWTPNASITHCDACRSAFGGAKIHHCRACGKGFCEKCSDYRRPVVERGWGYDPVRVCKACYDDYNKCDGSATSRPRPSPSSSSSTNSDSGDGVNARRVTERVVGTLAAVLDYPLSVIKDSARPAYWVPDEECDACSVCSKAFDAAGGTSGAGSAGGSSGPAGGVHHCRQCGAGVCDACSRTRMPAPLRGWDHPVRTCDACVQKANDPNNV